MASSKLPSLVVFDMAGTTLKDDGGIVNRALRTTLADAGIEVTPAQVNAVMGYPKPDAIAHLLALPKDDAKVVALHSEFVARMIDFYRGDPSVEEIEGTSLTFLKLRDAGVLLALDTGFSRKIADTVIDRLGWRSLIDASITSDEVPRGRPFPDMIDALLTKLEIADPKTVAKIGDTPSDLLEGASACCGWVVGVTQGSHTELELAAHSHTHLIPTVASLPTLFGL